MNIRDKLLMRLTIVPHGQIISSNLCGDVSIEQMKWVISLMLQVHETFETNHELLFFFTLRATYSRYCPRNISIALPLETNSPKLI